MKTISTHDGATAWARDFVAALTARDAGALQALLPENVTWRDSGALTWDSRQFLGRDAVITGLLECLRETDIGDIAVSDAWPAPHLRVQGPSTYVEAFFDFKTAAGHAVAAILGTPDETSSHGFVVTALYTRLEGLRDVEDPQVHPRGNGFTPDYEGQSFGEYYSRSREWLAGEPEVLVVGAGQAGLVAAAHLTRLGVSVLIVDRNQRVGDNWRNRYDALFLHNTIEVNEFPFLPYPDHYPEYLPKDTYGDWLEIYARYLDLNVWTSTDFLSAERDDSADGWSVALRRGDGTERVVKPRHLVLATGGIGGKPAIPDFPGAADFRGSVLHSSAYRRASDYDATSALVIGTATSAHDIALDLHQHGVDVTMIQRGPVVVNDIATANLVFADYADDDIPTDLIDIRAGISLTAPLRESGARAYHALAKVLDADLHAALQTAGMQLGDGHEGMGWPDLFLRTGGGYYLNKGASDVIVDGGISVIPHSRVRTLVGEGVLLDDGTVLEADLLVFATGFQNRRSEVEDLLGTAIADNVGDIARLDPEGEWAAMWGQSGQRGLWITGGAIAQVRPGSKLLALLVKADLDGRIPDRLRRRPKTVPAAAVLEPVSH